MNPEIKIEWLSDLKSGSITQTYGKLGSPDGSRCCLGVLCDIAVRHGVIEPPVVVINTLVYDSDTGYISESVANWAAFSNSDLLKTIDTLVSMNDSGDTFEEIAEVIEERL